MQDFTQDLTEREVAGFVGQILAGEFVSSAALVIWLCLEVVWVGVCQRAI